jgi:hypothetical protein
MVWCNGSSWNVLAADSQMYFCGTESCCFSVHCVHYSLLAVNIVEATLLHLSGHGRHCPSKYRRCRIGQTRNWFLTPGPITCYRVHLSLVVSLCASSSCTWVSRLMGLYQFPDVFPLYFRSYCSPNMFTYPFSGWHWSASILSAYSFHPVNALKPTGYYTYHQVWHSKILHGDYIAYLCFVWLSEETVTFAIYVINWLVFITEAESVYCAVRTESLYKIDTFRP